MQKSIRNSKMKSRITPRLCFTPSLSIIPGMFNMPFTRQLPSGGSRTGRITISMRIKNRSLCLALSLAITLLIGQRLSADEPTEQRPGALMLHTGKVVRGLISRDDFGFAIKQQSGNMFVPFNHVKYEADKVEDIYFELHKQLPGDDEPLWAAARIELAGWCRREELTDKAEELLRLVLKVDPDNQQARQLLKQLANPADLEEPEFQSYGSTPARGLDGFMNSNPEALGGFSTELAHEYVKTVQPLIVSKCGNGRCHGSQSKQEFQLRHARGSSRHHRLVSEQNLTAILKLVDTRQPRNSRLLMVLEENHGPLRKHIFAGPHAELWTKTLRDWVQQVASEKGDDRAKDDTTTDSADVAASTSRHGESRKGPPQFGPAQNGQARSGAQLSQGGVRQVGYEESSASGMETTSGGETGAGSDADREPTLKELITGDPFDPRVFNRKYGNVKR